MSTEKVTLDMVQEARARLKGVAHKTTLTHTRSISEMSGCDVFLKLENLQRTFQTARCLQQSSVSHASRTGKGGYCSLCWEPRPRRSHGGHDIWL